MSTHMTLKQALAGVGPGFHDLVVDVWSLCRSEKFPLTSVKQRMGQLSFTVEWEPETEMTVERAGIQRMLRRHLASVESDSLHTCEACGAWASLRSDGGPVPGSRRVLCDGCYARWNAGAHTWAELRGEADAGSDVILVDWLVLSLASKGFRLVGWDAVERKGHLSHEIASLNGEARVAVTRSGRVYRLGRAGHNAEGIRIAEEWCSAHGESIAAALSDREADLFLSRRGHAGDRLHDEDAKQ